ncbi:cytochrome P450 CYP749A22-like [Gossypium arboreum]|uniref:cytochrome P450 CYP749A22-like n=1 Tax=Gossypium arboreum TaxID=29729 RepID=UPI000819727F|nr:cytochrome P450 CYP749A22-like [Gossypium arboreum]
MGNLLIFFIASLGLCLFVALLYVLYNYWWVPHRVQFIMSSQGIRGPPYEFIHGNNKQILQMQKEAYSKPMALTHDIFPRVLPHVYSYIKKYGKNYLSWNGVQAQLVITDPELQGDSLVTSESEKRARQRKLANYAFHGESLKNMIPAIIASVETMLEKWKGKEGKEMEVFQEFRLLTSEMISRTAFSSSYLEGEKIFDMLMKLSAITGRNMYKAKILFIGKFWEPADEIESDKLAKMIHDSVMKIVKQKEEKVMTREADNFGRDFLGLLLNAYHDPNEKNRLSIQYVVDWQDKARAEVIEVFGNQNPNSQGIAKLKIITMIINETLRLYPPVHGVRGLLKGLPKLPTTMQLHFYPLDWDLHLVLE